MTNEMVLKNSQRKLVMPQHYIELECEEMSYIDGGYYIEQSIVDAVMLAIGSTVMQYGVTAVAMAIKGIGSLLFDTLHAIPVVGSFLSLVGKIWLIAQAENIAEAFVVAFVYRKGIDVSFGWHWFLPIIDFEARR